MAAKQEQVDVLVERMLAEWRRGMLTYWVLGLLVLRPMYGLEIRQEIEDSTKGRMVLGVSTVYQMLRRLERRGLLKSRRERSTQGPPRVYYEPTEAGRQVVRTYLTEVLSPQSPIFAAIGELTGQLSRVLLAASAGPTEGVVT